MSSSGRSYKTSAIVLRSRSYGEADRIVTLFSSLRGKMDAIAKGVRKTKSHLAGRLEFGNEVLLGMHRGRWLDVVVSADTEIAHWPAIVAPERFAAASVIAELVDAFCEPDLALPDVYALLGGALRAIGGSDEPFSLVPRFSVRLLDALGLAPPAETCARCGQRLAGRAWLDPDQGGFVGEECRVVWREMLEIDAADLENFNRLAAPRRGQTRPLRTATPRVALAIETLLHHHLGRRPKSGAHAAEFTVRRPAS